MLILYMLLRITGKTQEQFANFIGVSRASVSTWLNDDSSMSLSSKEIIASKFNFPIVYFNIDLNQDMGIYKVVFSTLCENWKKMCSSDEKSGNNSRMINDLLNQIEADFTTEAFINDVTDDEIIEGLINGYDPFTGEVFDDSHILKNKKVSEALIKLNNQKNKYKMCDITKEDLNNDQRAIFEELRKWRKDKRDEEGFYNAYIVFNDRELFNIILADVNKKEDLLRVKGIGEKKYNKYADELYGILKKGKYTRNDEYEEFASEYGF